MFLAQLMNFLVTHHHAMWVPQFFEGLRSFSFIYAWALHHGFVYHP